MGGGIHRLDEHRLVVVVATLQHAFEGHRDLRRLQQRAGTWARPERGGGVGVHEDDFLIERPGRAECIHEPGLRIRRESSAQPRLALKPVSHQPNRP
jgi:hypothetical protein